MDRFAIGVFFFGYCCIRVGLFVYIFVTACGCFADMASSLSSSSLNVPISTSLLFNGFFYEMTDLLSFASGDLRALSVVGKPVSRAVCLMLIVLGYFFGFFMYFVPPGAGFISSLSLDIFRLLLD